MDLLEFIMISEISHLTQMWNLKKNGDLIEV